MMRVRGVAVGGIVVALVLGLGVRAVTSGDFAKYGGDAVYAALIYGLVVLAVPRLGPPASFAAALGICWAVELFQLTSWPADWAAQSTLARLALGSTFNAPDLLAYIPGAALATTLHLTAQRPRTRAPCG